MFFFSCVHYTEVYNVPRTKNKQAREMKCHIKVLVVWPFSSNCI